MPAARRGTKKPTASTKKSRAASTKAATTKKGAGRKAAAEAEDDEDEEDDEEEAPKKGRQARDYGVTGEQLQQMRDDGMGWLEIMDEVGAKSAIPLRKILVAYQAEQDEEFQLDIEDGDAIVAARDDEGLGWGQIAARTGASVAEVKAAYTEAGGENLEGRAYRSKDGTVHFKLGSNAAASDEDEEDEDVENDEDEDEEEEAPAPKRRGRAKPAASKTKAATGAKARKGAKK